MTIEPTKEERLHRAIYAHYTQSGLKPMFERVEEKVYRERLTKYLDRIEIKQSDKRDIYRLSDSKDIWLGKYDKILGEVWIEDGVKSYWIRKH